MHHTSDYLLLTLYYLYMLSLFFFITFFIIVFFYYPLFSFFQIVILGHIYQRLFLLKRSFF
jgi:hypothetical protein